MPGLPTQTSLLWQAIQARRMSDASGVNIDTLPDATSVHISEVPDVMGANQDGSLMQATATPAVCLT